MNTVVETKQALNAAQQQLDVAQDNLRRARDGYAKAITDSQQLNARIERLRRYVGHVEMLAEAEKDSDPLAIHAIFNGPEVISALIREASKTTEDAKGAIQARQSQVNRAEFNKNRLLEQLRVLEEESRKRGLLQTVKDAIKITR